MKKLSTKEMKKIAYEIISKELEKYDLDARIFTVTTLEYYIKYIPSVNFESISDLIQTLKFPFITRGLTFWANYYKTSSPDIITFINYFKKLDNPLFELLKNCFHETRHCIQFKFDNYSYKKFLCNMEAVINIYAWSKYNSCHDDFSFEIGANIYGITKTKEFLKNNYPHIYNLEKNRIERFEKVYKLDYILYDATEQLDKTIDIVKSQEIQINNDYPCFNIFLNDNNSFKSMKDIIENPDLKKFDERILYTILSSNSYLESVDIEKLSNEELAILNEALQYTYTIYNNQYKFILTSFTNKDININYFNQMKKLLVEKIENINEYITLLNSVKVPKQYQYEFIKIRLKKKN